MVTHELEERRMTRAQLMKKIEELAHEIADLKSENGLLEDQLDEVIEALEEAERA